MAHYSSEDTILGRGSFFGAMGNMIPETTHLEPATGRESNIFNQQSSRVPKVTEDAGVEDADALCSEMQAMRIIVDDTPPLGELVIRRQVVQTERGLTRSRIILPSYSSVYNSNGERIRQDLFAENLVAYAATIISQERRGQRLRRVLRRRQKASRSKKAVHDPAERHFIEDDIFGADLWNDALPKTPSPTNASDLMGIEVGTRPQTAISRKGRLLTAECQQILLDSHCKRSCTCKTPWILNQWQVKLRDVYIERIFEYEQRQDMRRTQRSRPRKGFRTNHWKEACSKSLSMDGEKSELHAPKTATGARVMVTEVFGHGE